MPELPYSRDAEICVLGSILIDSERLDSISFLETADFLAAEHQVIFDAMLSLHERGEGIDQVTVAHELNRKDHLEEIGGASYLSSLIANTPTSLHADHFAKIVRQTAKLRRLFDLGRQMTQVVEKGWELDKVIELAETGLDRVKAKDIPRSLIISRIKIRKSNPPTYQLTILHANKEVNVDITLDELLKKQIFKQKLTGKLDSVPSFPKDYDAWIHGHLTRAEKVEAPEEASYEVQLKRSIGRFFDRYNESDEHSDLMTGGYAIKDNYYFFFARTMKKWLRLDMEREFEEGSRLWPFIEAMGGIERAIRVRKGADSQPVKLWGLPIRLFEPADEINEIPEGL